MDLTPKLLTEGTDFQQVRRGYDPDEVDDFLERVAAAVSRLQGQLVEANRRAEMAEAAAANPGQADAEGAVVEEMQRTLVLAQRTADAAVREAKDEAESLVAAARREAATILTNGRQEADRYAAESRLALSTDVRELEKQRDELHGMLAELEQHVEVQRERLRTSIEELQRVVDDPDAFRVEQPAGYEAPAPAPAPAAEPVVVAPVSEEEPAPEQAEVAPEPEPEPAPVSEVQPEAAPVAPDAPSEVPSYASAPSAPEVAPAVPVASPFGPPPSGGVQTMTSPSAVTAMADEPAAAPAMAVEPLIDLTHERPLPEGQDEDAFLAELRKAMTDDEPLGPREEVPGVVRTIGEVPIGRQRGRFGRRR